VRVCVLEAVTFQMQEHITFENPENTYIREAKNSSTLDLQQNQIIK
jgi:hypothetical protein